MHGFSLNDANTEAKKFIIKSYNSVYKKLIIITGKGSRSKTSDNPYVSRQMGILKNSIPGSKILFWDPHNASGS